MKKVLIGLLFLIPIIILLLVAAVSQIVSTAAYIGVESISLNVISGEEFIEFNLSDIGVDPIDLNEYIEVEVLPEKATNRMFEWELTDVRCLDENYEKAYKNYIQNPSTSEKVNPAAMLVDELDNELEQNTTGLLRINAYCSFKITVSAESYSAAVNCRVVGYDVESINIVNKNNQNGSIVKVGDSFKLYANMTPIDSIVDTIEWYSSDDTILSVDSNGIVTALKNGSAYIYLKASKYSKEEMVESARYSVTVETSLSLYGNSFYSHLTSLDLNLEKYGIDVSSIESCVGGTITSGVLQITSTSATITTSKGNIVITKCDEDAFVIENAALLNSDSDEVVEVDGRPLKLKVAYLSIDNESAIAATWSSSDELIATVDENGVVTAKSSGLVTITATIGTKVASIELNVQKKVTSMTLYTSNTYYEKELGGFARETVFASERFVDCEALREGTTNYKQVDFTNAFEDNYTFIRINGYTDSKYETDLEYLNAYNFEVIEGKEYASFDVDIPNKLMFSSNLRGKGKQEIIVKVSAKYPKYSTRTTYTEEEVTIKAIYGVEVNEIYEIKLASFYQRIFALDKDNAIATLNDTYTTFETDKPAYVSSKEQYSICMMSNIYYPESLKDPYFKYFIARHMYKGCVALYGDLYGNNHTLNGNRDLTLIESKDDGNGKYCPFLKINWSDVTVSNLNIRVNQLENAEIVTGDDTKELRGKAISIYREDEDRDLDPYNDPEEDLNISEDDIEDEEYDADKDYFERLHNIRLEYSIIENTYQAMNFDNIDITMDGVLIRNLCNIGCYVGSYLRESRGIFQACYSHINIHNCVVSNALGSAFSIDQDGLSKDDTTGQNRFSNNYEENMERVYWYIDRNYCNVLNQTGFYDIYNWQCADDAKLIQTGDDTYDLLVGGLTQELLAMPMLDNLRYRYKGVDYFNVGFVVSAISNGGVIITEPIFSKIIMEDSRFTSFALADFAVSDDPVMKVLSSFDVRVYAYTNQSDLKPSTTLIINDKFINKLHR